MYKRILSVLLSMALLAPSFFVFNTPNAHALGNVVTISNSANDALFPNITTDNKGYLHVVWQEYSGNNDVNPGIFYSRWNGDTWSAPINVSENTGFAGDSSIITDTSRTVHLTWDDDSAEHGIPKVLYRTRTEAGVLSSIENLPVPAGNLAIRNPEIAINNSGNPTIVFSGIDASNVVKLYQSTKSSGVWSTPVIVSTNAAGANTTRSRFSEILSDTLGNMHLVYWDTNEGIFYRKYSGGTWGTAVNLATGNNEYVRASVTPSGEVFVTWRSVNDTSIKVRWTISGNWQTATSLTTTSSNSSWGLPIMGVTTDSANRAHVGWGEKDAGGLTDLKYRSYIGGTWQTAQDLDLDNKDADSPFVYPDLWDNQHFAWAEKNVSTDKWEILYRVNEGTISTVPTSGGTVTSNPFSTTQATLTIPNGALNLTTQIGIQVGPIPATINPNVVTIPKAYTFRPHGLNFNAPATARIFYTTAEAAGADEALLQPWLWDSQTNTYTAQTVVRRSAAQNWMEVELTHFSLYGIAAPRVNVEWKKPTNKLVKGKKIDFEFVMKYADGNPVVEPANSEELRVTLKDSNEVVVQILKYQKKGVEKHGNDKFSGKFEVAKELSGTYTIEVELRDGLMSSRQVTLQ